MKMIIKDSGEEITFGQKIRKTVRPFKNLKIEELFTNITFVEDIELTRENLQQFIDKGIIEIKNEDSNEELIESLISDLNTLIAEEADKQKKAKEIQDKIYLKYGTTHHISEYIINIANRMKWDAKKTARILDRIQDIYPAAAFSILLKEIAISFDQKYPKHISTSDKIFVVSMANGNIVEMNKDNIKSYKNFAAFRTFDDAKEALIILEGLIPMLF